MSTLGEWLEACAVLRRYDRAAYLRVQSTGLYMGSGARRRAGRDLGNVQFA